MFASRSRNVEARGVASVLAAQLVALTGSADKLSQDLRMALESSLGAEASVMALRATTEGLRAIADQHGASTDNNEEESRAMNEATRALEVRIATMQNDKASLEQRLGVANKSVRQALDEYNAAESSLVRARDEHQSSTLTKLQAKNRYSFAAGRGSALESCVAALKIHLQRTQLLHAPQPEFPAPMRHARRR